VSFIADTSVRRCAADALLRGYSPAAWLIRGKSVVSRSDRQADSAARNSLQGVKIARLLKAQNARQAGTMFLVVLCSPPFLRSIELRP
jgi:hypothetical protein